MKSALIVPRITNSIFEPSRIEQTYDCYFGHGYQLLEFGYRELITKELAQCYRKHAQLVHNNPDRFKLHKKNYK